MRLGHLAAIHRYPVNVYGIEGRPKPRPDGSIRPPRPRRRKRLPSVATCAPKWMGIYCDVLRAGTARVGDVLELFAR